jgi:hypothetical protein
LIVLNERVRDEGTLARVLDLRRFGGIAHPDIS